MSNGIAFTNIPHPEGDPVPDDHEFKHDSLETIEIDLPVMPEDQLETWMHNMIRACNRSTCDSDINVIKLIQHIENLYMQGRADERDKCAQDYLQDCADAVEAARIEEREACAKLCDELAREVGNKNFIAVDQRQFCAKQIRQRGEK